MKELCSRCKQDGFCQFEKEADKIANLANSDRINSASALEAIAEMRIYARKKRLCPNINRVNPRIKEL
jgi:hypothetical protein